MGLFPGCVHRELADDDPLGSGIPDRVRIVAVLVISSRFSAAGLVRSVTSERAYRGLLMNRCWRALEIGAETTPPRGAMPRRGKIVGNRRDEWLIHQAKRRPAFAAFSSLPLSAHGGRTWSQRDALASRRACTSRENRRIRLRQSAKLEGACFAGRDGDLLGDHRYLRGVRGPAIRARIRHA